ncbi:MAG: PAS domain-containing sensor histidine kinase [Bacteroidales bacterium]|nr:PAS domain-containing sensor histidine kinase [Bacteroidales bacterium]
MGFWIAIGVLTVVLVIIGRRYRRLRRRVDFLLDALTNGDTSLHIPEKAPDRKAARQLNQLTEIVQSERQQVKEREVYYEAILRSVGTGIYVVNSQGHIVTSNSSARQLLGREVLTHVSQLPDIASTCPSVTVNQSSVMIGGTEFQIYALHDIHRELEAREARSWTEMARILSHELLNGLAPIISITDTLQGPIEPAEMKEGLEAVNLTAQGLQRFVNSFRQLLNTPRPVVEKIEMQPFMGRMVLMAHHQPDSEGVVIGMKGDDCQALADSNLLTQVCVNLLTNALQALKGVKGAKVEIKVMADPSTVKVDFTNNGPAIPESMALKIFLPFFTTREEGNGIGLSLSRQLMTAMRGSLTLLSHQPVRFRLTLPRA